ncbi:MAG TPA: hypothetical protein VJL34_08165, partial [Anaerolineales bacterium]|nr:hypothetical protein [Anaerolineales bacterium]
MASIDSLALGLIFLAVGLGLAALAMVALRYFPKNKPREGPPTSSPISLNLEAHGGAVLIVQAGGRIVYLNERAREWFDLGDEQPDLERLARRVRPSEALFSL